MVFLIAKGKSRDSAAFGVNSSRVVTGMTNSCICVRSCSGTTAPSSSGASLYQTAQSAQRSISSLNVSNVPAKSSGWQVKYTLGFPFGSPIPIVL